MPKYILGSIFGAILSGIALIFTGRQLYPEISISYSIFWLLLAGTLAGLCIGFAGHFISKMPQLLLSAIGIGALFFGIFSVILTATILYSLLLGGAIGLVTGYIIHTFGSNNWIRIQEIQD